MNKVVINHQDYFNVSVKEETFTHEATNRELRKFKLDFIVIGQEQRSNLIAQTDSPFDIILDNEIKLRVKKANSSWSYKNDVDETTKIPITLELVELDPELPEDHDIKNMLNAEVILNWIRTRATSELLVEKGIISKEEYEEKLKDLIERDGKNLAYYIAYGKPEPAKE